MTTLNVIVAASADGAINVVPATIVLRDMFHLTSRINRKLLAHTVCYWLNRDHSCPLNFEDLVSA